MHLHLFLLLDCVLVKNSGRLTPLCTYLSNKGLVRSTQ